MLHLAPGKLSGMVNPAISQKLESPLKDEHQA
jgi:hypothetical protein